MNPTYLNARAAFTAIWMTLAAISANAANYELASGFDAEANPGAVWSCGWSSNIGGEFQPLTFKNTTASDNGVALRAWQYSSSEQPAVNWNSTTNVAIVYGGLSSLAPGDVFIHPGPDASARSFGVVRFTLPLTESGLYRLEATVAAVLTNGPSSDTDFYVVKNGREVVGWILPAGKGAGYTNQLQLAPGEKVDFLIGRGADGHEYGGALKIRARFVPLNVVTSQPPVILAQPQSQAVVAGGNASFAVTASGAAPLAYRWLFNDGVIASATNSALTLNNVQPAQAGEYRVVVGNVAGSVTSAVAILTVTGLSNAVWDLSSFSAATNPGAVWSYGWFSEVAGPFHLLTFAKGFNSDNGVPVRSWQYSNTEQPVVHWNSLTNPAILYGGQAICPPGAVWFHPGPEGSGHNFSAVRFTAPAGVSGSYRLESAFPPFWVGASASDTDIHVVQNGVEIFSQFLTSTNGTTFTNTLNLVAGDTVDFLIGRGRDNRYYGDGLKIQARFVALPAPPAPTVFDVSAFSPMANPGSVWSYGWFTNIGGKFTLLNFAKTPPADNGVPINSWQFSEYEQPVVAWNGTTNVAIVFDGQTSFPPGSVWFHPGPDGSPRNFGAIRFTMPTGRSGNYRLESTVAAVLTNSPSGDTDFHVVKNGAEIFGQFLAAGRGTVFTNEMVLAAGDTVDFLIGRGADGHEYGGALKIATRFVPLNVVTSQMPVILAQPQSRSVVAGSNVILSVTAIGTPPLTFRWLLNNGVIASATNSSLAINNVQPSQAGDYRVVVSNTAGSATSAVATLTVILSPSTVHDLTKDFSTTDNPNGVWRYGYKQAISGSFSNLAYHRIFPTGEGVPIQVWEFSPNGDPAIFLNGSTSTATSDGGAGVYPPGTVWFAPGFDGQPQNFGAIRFTVPPAGTGLYRLETSARTYLDRSPGGDSDFHVVKDGVELFGQFLATPSETSFTNVLSLVSGETIDFLVGRGQDGRLYGSGLKIKATLVRIETNAAPPAILAQPQSQTVVAGGNATFAVTASGPAPLTYRWLFNDGVIASATNSALTLNNVQPAQAGEYRVVVGNVAGSVTSAVAILTVTGLSNAVWDLSSFSAATNPGAVWSYGWFTNLGGSFMPLSYAKTSTAANGVPVQSWQYSSFEQPAVYWNGTTNTAVFNGGQSVCPPGTVWAHPGPDGSVRNFGAVRFTVPAGGAGVYRLESAFRALLDGGTAGDTEIHVLHNGVAIFGQNLAAHVGTGYTNAIQLAAGDRVDFAVGRGVDGHEYASALKITARFVEANDGSNPPPRVAGIEYLSEGQVEAKIESVLGSSVEIQVSTNLTHWISVTNCVNRNGAIRFADPERFRAPMRFYRVRPAGN